MRVVHYVKWLRQRDGGVVRAAVDLASLLARAGDHVTILTCDDADVAALSPHGNVRIVKLNLVDPVARLRGRSVADAEADTPSQLLDRASRRIVRETLKGADVVHLHGVWTTSTWQVASLARRAGVAYVVSAHGMLDDWCMAQGSAKKRLHLKVLSGRGLRGARAVHCTAKAEAEQVARNVPGVNARVVALPFDAGAFVGSRRDAARAELARRYSALSEINDRTPLVVFMSRLNVKKGVLALIEAWGEVRAADAPVLVLAGPFDPAGYEERVRGAIAASPARERIHVVGMVAGAERLALLAGADLFALPTSQENFGYVLLEAMASGTPILTTKGVDIWPELDSSGACTLIAPEAGAIAGAVTALLRDRGALHQAGQSARAWATAYSEPAALAAAYRDMYFGRIAG